MGTEKLEKKLREIFDNSKYVVPLYQRNYAWRKDEIERLLQDVYEAYKNNPNGNYFIGSLVVLKRQNGDLEVIDGQQRLTTLSLITKILGINKTPCLFYDSRPEVEEFFKEFYKNSDLDRIDYPQTIHLRNAIDYINEANLDPNSLSPVSINSVRDELGKYFFNNVILIRVEIPEDTDVASYFEIMNNRGVQLQKHEILKSFLVAKLGNLEERTEFSRLWDACSQMNVPIQRLFNADGRKKYFGDLFDTFVPPFGTQNQTIKESDQKYRSIDEIIQEKVDGCVFENKNDDENDDEEEVSEYKSIIDFPNFLMHVIKIKYNDYYNSLKGDSDSKDKDIALNEKDLLSVYNQIKSVIEPKDFIQTLFFCRVVFDRYIVKTITDKSVEDEIKWTLQKPKKYEKNWKYVNAFDDADQNRIVKALSMLQVTFRTRIYKNWLQDVLKWFVEKCPSVDIGGKDYLSKLNELILQYYEERKIEYAPLSIEDSITRENSYSLGTNTPHFIFNFIDYLYWMNLERKNKNDRNDKIKDFDFKYWNSVEHHMAREWAERNGVENRENFIDCLGNLCLISKGSNSRLSDRDVKEKVQTFGSGNLGIKRQVMYDMSKDAEDTYTWTEAKIKQHYNDVLSLISKRAEILHVN
jgi:uncharacterized protein with ParB-like and HNH nuclease domain